MGKTHTNQKELDDKQEDIGYEKEHDHIIYRNKYQRT